MKTGISDSRWGWLGVVAATAVIAGSGIPAKAAEENVVITATASAGNEEEAPAKGSATTNRKLVITAIDDDEAKGAREMTWLGVATVETSEALASQLGLNPGEGLLITFVGPDSPAVKAGLQKNDVLVEFEDQLLVHPAQLRKLIQRQKEGDKVKLTIYRGGKKETLTAVVGKRKAGFGLLLDDQTLKGNLQELKMHLHELPLGEKMRELREELANAGIDKDSIRIEVKKSMEEVRKSLQEVLRQATNAHRTFGPAAREFRELARRGIDVDKDATVIVKSKRDAVKTIVKTDDSGTYVVVANPKKQLTAHDKSGKLVFDGEIETSHQQEKVPKEVWEKVEPMLDQLKGDSEKPDKAEEAEDEEKGGI